MNKYHLPKIKPIIKNALFPFIGLILFFIVWYILARVINLELILPSPSQSFQRLSMLFAEKYFWVAVGNTFFRSIISFSLSLFFAIILSIIGYLFTPVHKMLGPMIIILRSIPTMSIILLALIWFKNSISPIVISAVVTFPILYSGFFSSLEEVDKGLIEMSQFFKVPVMTQITKLYLPYISSPALSAIQSGLSFNIKLIIAAEVLASTSLSMGGYMQVAKVYLDTAELMGWTIMAIILSYMLEFIIYCIKKACIRWR